MDNKVEVSQYKKLYDKLGYTFHNPKILQTALTRPGVSNKDYERLEFVGDRVLNLVISARLYYLFPNASPGQLHQQYTSLTRNSAPEKKNGGPLYRVAKELKLEEFIIGKEKKLVNLKRRVTTQSSHTARKRSQEWQLSDHVEAIIGAVYVDSGEKIEPARKFILDYWHPLGLNDDEQSIESFGETTLGNLKGLLTEEEQQKLNKSMLTAAKQVDLKTVVDNLEQGAEVNELDSAGYTVLHYFVRKNNYNAVDKLVFEYRANIDLPTKSGVTALIFSTVNGYSEITDLLLEFGANAEAVYQKNSVLELAIIYKKEKSVEKLLDHLGETLSIISLGSAIKLNDERNSKSEKFPKIKNLLLSKMKKLVDKRQAQIDANRKLKEEMFLAFELQVDITTFKSYLVEVQAANKKGMHFVLYNSTVLSNYRTNQLQKLGEQLRSQEITAEQCSQEGEKIRSLHFNRIVKFDFTKFKEAIEKGSNYRGMDQYGLTIFHYLSLIDSSEAFGYLFKHQRNFRNIKVGDIPNLRLITSVSELKDVDFSWSNLSGNDFSNVNKLRNVRFDGANLTKVIFKNLVFENVSFKNANLEGTKFNNARMDRASFVSYLTALRSKDLLNYHNEKYTNPFVSIQLGNVDLSGIDLTGINLNSLNLYHAQLDHVTLSSMLPRLKLSTDEQPLRELDLRGLDVDKVELQNVNLRGVYVDIETLSKLLKKGNIKPQGIKVIPLEHDFQRIGYGKYLGTIDVEQQDLSGHDFSGITFYNANFDNSKLNNVKFNNAILQNCSFKNSEVSNLQLEGAVIDVATLNALREAKDGKKLALKGAKLGSPGSFGDIVIRYADFSSMNFEGFDFSKVKLYFVDFAWAKLKDANFSEAVIVNSSFYRNDFVGCIFKPKRCYGVTVSDCQFKDTFLNEQAFITLINQAKLRKLDLSGVKLTHESFRGSWFPGTPQGTGLSTSYIYELNDIQLDGADFSESSLTKELLISLLPSIKENKVTANNLRVAGCDLNEEDFSHKQFSQIKFTSTSFKKSNLSGMTINNCQFEETHFVGANIKDTKVTESCFIDCSLSVSVADKAVFTNVVFSGFSISTLLKRAKTNKLTLINCVIENKKLENRNVMFFVQPDHVELKKRDFSKVDIQSLRFASKTLMDVATLKSLLPAWFNGQVDFANVRLNSNNVIKINVPKDCKPHKFSLPQGLSLDNNSKEALKSAGFNINTLQKIVYR